MLHFSVGDIKAIVHEWWQEKRQDETIRKASSVELSGALPDGTKFAVKEYAKDSQDAYQIAYRVVSEARRDFATK